jgi:hypothetical protein
MTDSRNGDVQRESVTNVEAVTFALAELDGASQPVHLEDIAVKAFEHAPGAFRWDLDEYSERIDKDKVRVSLTDAQKDKYGHLVQTVGAKRAGISKPTDAWQLTSSGAEWYLRNRHRVAAALGLAQPSLKKSKAAELRARIQRSELYAEFLETGQVAENPFIFADLLECSPDASNQVIQQKLDALMSQVRLLDDPGLVDFLRACSHAHSDMLVI